MITPFGLRHVELVRELEAGCIYLDPGSLLAEPPATPLRTALQGYFLKSSGAFTYVLRAVDRGVLWRGFAQAQAMQTNLAWKVACLAPDLEASADAATIWYRLLLHICIAAGERHVQRLYACVRRDDPAEEVLRQASFSLYCHDRVFTLVPGMSVQRVTSQRVRPARPEDAWGVQRLRFRTTPRPVQQAEELNGTHGERQPFDITCVDGHDRFVLSGQGDELRGFLSVSTIARGFWIGVLIHPDERDGATELLSHALSVLRNATSKPVYCAVREYQSGVLAALEHCGFTSVADRSLLVKHTTVQVREAQRKLVPAIEKRAGVVPMVSHSEQRAHSGSRERRSGG